MFAWLVTLWHKGQKTYDQICFRQLGDRGVSFDYFSMKQRCIYRTAVVCKHRGMQQPLYLSVEFDERFWDFAAIEKDILLLSFPFSMDPNDALSQLQLELIELQFDN